MPVRPGNPRPEIGPRIIGGSAPIVGKMRILHILDHSIPLHSGYTFRTRAILEQQRARGWETFHITGPKHDQVACPASSEEEVDGFRFYRTALPGGWSGKVPGFHQWALIGALERRLHAVAGQLRPDVLHAHSPALNGEAALRVGRRLGIPVVYEVRAFWEDAAVDHGTSSEWGLRYRLSRALETRVLKRAQAVTTICEGLRSEMIGRGIPGARITVIPNAVDTARFETGRRPDPELVRELGLTGGKVLGFIGSFYAYEGLSLLLRALPAILRAESAAQVLLVGGGPQEAELRRLAEALGVADRVRFAGRVPHDQVQRYYDLVDIFVYPRLPMRLTELVTPLKPLEAMAQGRLVLASDVGGHRELIRAGENGVLFPAGDVAALAAAAVELMRGAGRAAELRSAGRRFVEAERNWPLSVARYEPVYRAVRGGAADAS